MSGADAAVGSTLAGPASSTNWSVMSSGGLFGAVGSSSAGGLVSAGESVDVSAAAEEQVPALQSAQEASVDVEMSA